nr:uncharacterized protein LOC117224138 [Megalopta genalis]
MRGNSRRFRCVLEDPRRRTTFPIELWKWSNERLTSFRSRVRPSPSPLHARGESFKRRLSITQTFEPTGSVVVASSHVLTSSSDPSRCCSIDRRAVRCPLSDGVVVRRRGMNRADIGTRRGDGSARDERTLDREDLLNYFKNLERAFRRDVGDEGVSRRNRRWSGHPGYIEKAPRRHLKKIIAPTDFRVREGWSEADVERLRDANSGCCPSQTNRSEGNASVVPLFVAGTKAFFGAVKERSTGRSSSIVLNDDCGVFGIVDDLKSSEILRCEELLNERCEKRSGATASARNHVTAGPNLENRRKRDPRNAGERIRPLEDGTVKAEDRDPCKQLTNTRRERFDWWRVTDSEAAAEQCVESGRRCAANVDVERPRDRYGNRDRIVDEATGKIRLKASRAESREQATRPEYACTGVHRFDSRSHLERVRETVHASESDATCCSCGVCRAAFRLDFTANDDSTGQLETPTSCRKCAPIAAVTRNAAAPSRSRLSESRSNLGAAIACRPNERRFSNRCRDGRSFREPFAVRKRNEKTIAPGNSFGDYRGRELVKPMNNVGKARSRKVLVYPPRGQAGPPLTLYKSSSNIDCVVDGSPRNGFRYSVTYVQTFRSSFWRSDDRDW